MPEKKPFPPEIDPLNEDLHEDQIMLTAEKAAEALGYTPDAATELSGVKGGH